MAPQTRLQAERERQQANKIENVPAAAAINASHEGDVNEGAELQSRLRSKKRMNNDIQYLPHIGDLLDVRTNVSLKEAKKKMLSGNLDMTGKSAVLFKNCFNAISYSSYKSLLKGQKITQSDYAYVAEGVYGKVTTDILPTRTDNGTTDDNMVNKDWQTISEKMLAGDGSIDRGHPIAIAQSENRNDSKKCALQVWKQFLEQVRQKKICKIASAQGIESSNPPQLLKDGFNNPATPENDNSFESKYEVGTALFSTPIRQGNGLDQILILRQGAPRYYLIFRREQSSELMKSFCLHVQQSVQRSDICSQLLLHGNYMLADELVRGMGVPCVLFRQDAGDAVYIPYGTFWASVSVGTNLVESRYFISPLCYAAMSARLQPCNCRENKSLAVTVNEEARVKATISKTKSVKCRLCPAIFKSVSECDRHMTTDHGEHYYICNECGSTFGKASKLQRHEDTHAGKRFRCEICDKLVANIDTHRRTHYDSVSCPNCYKTFSYRYMKETHSKQCVAKDQS